MLASASNSFQWRYRQRDAAVGVSHSSKVGLIAEIPDLGAFQEFMQSDAAAEAMKQDGVRPETVLVLAAS